MDYPMVIVDDIKVGDMVFDFMGIVYLVRVNLLTATHSHMLLQGKGSEIHYRSFDLGSKLWCFSEADE